MKRLRRWLLNCLAALSFLFGGYILALPTFHSSNHYTIEAFFFSLGPFPDSSYAKQYIAAALMLFPVFLAIVRITRKAPCRQGYCENCGYDLRATPERCPECGNVPKSL